jgi:acetyltransferase-like isoleucine patch superfamily enzyme
MGLFAHCLRVAQATMSRLRNVGYRLLGVKFGGYVWLRRIEIPRNHRDIHIARGASLDQGVVLLCSGEAGGQPKIVIGSSTYINRFTILDASLSLEIGSECAIGPGCYLTDHDHGHSPNTPPLSLPLQSKPTKLGNRVWLGAHVVVLKGVHIGDGAVIGAGSVVTKDVPAGSLALGVPARIVRTHALDAQP